MSLYPHDMAEAMAKVLVALTPRLEAQCRFKLLAGEWSEGGVVPGTTVDPWAATRCFVVYQDGDIYPSRWGGFNGTAHQPSSDMVVDVRYVIPVEQGGWRRANRLMSADKMLIDWAFRRDAAVWASILDSPPVFTDNGRTRAEQDSEGNDIYKLSMRFETMLCVGDCASEAA